jgi:WhiB family redox-sensing transcriptional regulator
MSARLAEVAKVANHAHRAGLAATEAVANHFNVTLRYASRLLSRAREAGHTIPMSRSTMTDGMVRSIDVLRQYRIESSLQKFNPAIWNIDNWRESANCRGVDPNLFHPERGANQADVAAARIICGKCVVSQQCLQFALDNHETKGIWGGLTEKQRRRLRSQRNINLTIVPRQTA